MQAQLDRDTAAWIDMDLTNLATDVWQSTSTGPDEMLSVADVKSSVCRMLLQQRSFQLMRCDLPVCCCL